MTVSLSHSTSQLAHDGSLLPYSGSPRVNTAEGSSHPHPCPPVIPRRPHRNQSQSNFMSRFRTTPSGRIHLRQAGRFVTIVRTYKSLGRAPRRSHLPRVPNGLLSQRRQHGCCNRTSFPNLPSHNSPKVLQFYCHSLYGPHLYKVLGSSPKAYPIRSTLFRGAVSAVTA